MRTANGRCVVSLRLLDGQYLPTMTAKALSRGKIGGIVLTITFWASDEQSHEMSPTYCLSLLAW
jgi:hypothetical protein